MDKGANVIIRSSQKPAGSILLPDARVAERGRLQDTGMSSDLRDIVMDAHKESAIAVAVDGLVLEVSASQNTSTESPEVIEAREVATVAAVEQGYQEGLVRGFEKASADWMARIEDFDRLLDTLAEERNELLPKLEDDLVTVAYGAIVQIVGGADLSRNIVREAIRNASSQVGNESPITVRVAPAQFKLIDGSDGIDLGAKRKVPIEVVEDPRVVLGGCIIETGRGTLDARLETQLDRLKKVLLSARISE